MHLRSSTRAILAHTHMSRNMTKPTKWHVRPAKTQISLGIRPVWSESSLSAWRKLGSLATHWAHSEYSDQTGRMPRLIWVFALRTVIVLVLSWGGSYTRVVPVNRDKFYIHSLHDPKKVDRQRRWTLTFGVCPIITVSPSPDSLRKFCPRTFCEKCP